MLLFTTLHTVSRHTPREQPAIHHDQLVDLAFQPLPHFVKSLDIMAVEQQAVSDSIGCLPSHFGCLAPYAWLACMIAHNNAWSTDAVVQDWMAGMEQDSRLLTLIVVMKLRAA